MNHGTAWSKFGRVLVGLTSLLAAQEITVLRSQKEVIRLVESDRWWAEKERGRQLVVPHKLVLAITQRWRKEVPQMPASTKRELFYASLRPLVVHANTLVMDRREKIADADKRLARGQTLSTEELAKLQDMAVLLRIEPPDEGAKLRKDIEAMRKSGELHAVVDRMRLE